MRYLQKKKQVNSLKEEGCVKKINYLTWLSNVILAPKVGGDVHMCVDFIHVNMVTPKDYFPLPITNQLVDANTGFSLMSFMETYSSFHQIRMHPKDE